MWYADHQQVHLKWYIIFLLSVLFILFFSSWYFEAPTFATHLFGRNYECEYFFRLFYVTTAGIGDYWLSRNRYRIEFQFVMHNIIFFFISKLFNYVSLWYYSNRFSIRSDCCAFFRLSIFLKILFYISIITNKNIALEEGEFFIFYLLFFFSTRY